MASVGTYIQYGNVKLYRVVTHEIRQEPVLDPSGTDLIYQKTTVRVSGYLHGHTNWSYLMAEPIAPYGGATAAHKLMRYQLPPRQPFIMAIGAVENGVGMKPDVTPSNQPIVILEAYPAPARVSVPQTVKNADGDNVAVTGNINLKNWDVANGPRCVDFVVSHITGNELFHVDATFELCKVECTPDGSVPYNSYGVLSNRWSVSDSLDVNMRTTRTYTGTMVLASAKINAHQLRWLVAPPLEPLFRRERMEFVWEADGLKLHWVVTDQEIAASAPFPARRWNVQHTIRTHRAMMGAASIQIQVEGDSDVNKADLIEICHWVIAAKMFRRTPPQVAADPAEVFVVADGNGNLVRKPISYIVDRVEFTDHIGDTNVISAAAEVRTLMTAKDGMALAFQNFGQPIVAANLPAPLDGTKQGVGDNFPYNAGTNQKYSRARSWGGYAGQTPDVEGPAGIVGIVACYFQTPCNDQHFPQYGIEVLQKNEDKQAPVDQIPYTATEMSSLQLSLETNATPYSENHMTYPYTFWQVDNLYKTNAMRTQMPIAKTPTGTTAKFAATSAVVRIAGGQTRRVIRISAERAGDWPEFPDPETLAALQWPYPESIDREIGWVPLIQSYLRSALKAGRSVTTATGQVIFRASMEIVLALSRPPTPKEKLALGNEKWTSKGPQTTTTTLTNSDWSQ